MPVRAGLANSSSNDAVEHDDIGVEVRRDECATRRWLVRMVASRLVVEAVVSGEYGNGPLVHDRGAGIRQGCCCLAMCLYET